MLFGKEDKNALSKSILLITPRPNLREVCFETVLNGAPGSCPVPKRMESTFIHSKHVYPDARDKLIESPHTHTPFPIENDPPPIYTDLQ